MSLIDQLLQARYGDAAPTAVAASNELIDALLDHKSVRAYLPDALPEGTLELLISAAQSASTSSNLQAWSVVAVEDTQRKERLAKLSGNQQHIIDAPLFLAWIADLARLEKVIDDAGESTDGLNLIESFLIGVIDATLAAQNVAVAAESLGLGTVYIGGLRNHPELVAEELGLPPRTFPVFGLVVGVPDPDKPAAVKPRLPQSAVLHWERYQQDTHDSAVNQYDKVIGKFYASQNLPQQQWTQHITNRVKNGSTGTRTRLLQSITNLGFKI